MTLWQTIIAAGILLSICGATIRDRRVPWLLAVVMTGNFFATMALSPESPLALVGERDSRLVAMVDLACAAALLGYGRREFIVAGLFAIMIPFYLATHYLWLYPYLSYAIIDAIALTQFLVIGWPNGGSRIHGTNRDKSRHSGLHLVDTRVRAFDGAGVSRKESPE